MSIAPLVWVRVEPGTTLTLAGRNRSLVIDDATAYRAGGRLYATQKGADLLKDRLQNHQPNSQSAEAVRATATG